MHVGSCVTFINIMSPLSAALKHLRQNYISHCCLENVSNASNNILFTQRALLGLNAS